ncbi:MAG TPA: PPOX class F420-dependent oxidoreductase [Candidatus Dormibacteraeota bacterium]|jgi:PPOX class probable F420-dependent enzyme
MKLAEALDLARGRRQGALVTIGREGRPQISNIMYAMDVEGAARISTTASTIKTRNLGRDPRCSLYVAGEHFFQYVVLDGTADLSAVAEAPEDDVVDVLVQIYRAVSGEHPDWNEFRTAMVRDRRLVVTVRPEHAYGMLGG